jgi:cellulose synthase/poly-beta-1,6-N-acetylglucosamine synthase-like glycosyltransferase
MIRPAVLLVAAGLSVGAYAYLGYPLLLMLLCLVRRRRPRQDAPPIWPLVSITVPAYNEEAAIRATLDALLAIDYPSDRRQILVVSDASTDGTDMIVAGYADRGVELLRMPVRGGKTAAENAAQGLLRGEIIINTDASVRIDRAALKPLLSVFGDPTIGVASSRDVSVSRAVDTANLGEAGYVGYEMWVRRLETLVYGIVGSSGSLYAIRAQLHKTLVPEALSRDFASALFAREQGFRAVSVPDAVCFVPRARSLHGEYRRKVRTMTRGLETLWYKRSLLDPVRYGAFAFMLASHKLVRWLVPWGIALALPALAALSVRELWARFALGLGLLFIGMGVAGWLMPEERGLPRIVAIPAYVCSGLVAALHAWINALGGDLNPVWEPTRRDSVRRIS